MTKEQLQLIYTHVHESDKLLKSLNAKGYIPRHFRRTQAMVAELHMQAEAVKVLLLLLQSDLKS